MNYSTYRFTLDIHKTKSQVSIPVLFQDTGVQFYINLTDGGKPYHISDGCRAVLYGRKPKQNPDGTYDCLVEDCEIIDDGTRIRYEFSDQTTTLLGSVACEIRLYTADGKLLTTPAFEILVEARVIEDDEIIESADERTALDRIFESEAAREEAYQEAERARDADFEEQKEAFNKAFNEALSKQAVDSDVTFKNSVSIEGDLSVKGKHYVVEANSLFVKDKFIACNFLEADKEEPGVRGTAGFLMIAGAKDYNELGETEYPAYGIVYNYYKDAVFLGKGRVNYIGHFKEQEGQYYVDFWFDEGEAQAIATRSDTIPNGTPIMWDATNNKMVGADKIVQEGHFLYINKNGAYGNEYWNKMSGIVIPTSFQYDGAENVCQDAYAIVYDHKTKTLRLGTGQITHSMNLDRDKGEIDYNSFEFGGYMHETGHEDEAIATRADDFVEGHIPQWNAARNMFVDSGKSIDDVGSGSSGGGLSIEDIIQINTKTGNLVKWDATQNKLVDTGLKPSTDTSTNTIPIRESGGGIKVGSKTGNINWATNIRTVEMAQSFNYVNYFPSTADENGEHIVAYVEAGFAAVGWQNSSKVEPGILTGVPHSNVGDTWYQKVCNGSPNSKTLVVRDALVWGDKTSLSQMLNTFTDKVEEAWDRGNNLHIKVAPKCTVYIQCRIVSKGYSQISIT